MARADPTRIRATAPTTSNPPHPPWRAQREPFARRFQEKFAKWRLWHEKVIKIVTLLRISHQDCDIGAKKL